MFQHIKDPDDNLVALFKQLSVPDDNATIAEGRPVFKDQEVVEIRKPGAKDYSVHLAIAVSHWVEDPFTGGQTQITYAERFRRQYQQFKAQAAQTKSGTPLDYASFLTESRRAELRAQNIYTVEQLAAVDGAELKNLGPGGRDMKNAAVEYIEAAAQGAPNLQMAVRAGSAEGPQRHPRRGRRAAQAEGDREQAGHRQRV